MEVDTQTGLIEKVTSATGKADVVCGEDELIFPGFIDLHVHAREDVSGKQNYKEDYESASAAAINGGVAHFCDMPNNPVAPVDEKKYLAKLELTKKASVDVTLYAGVGPGTKPLLTSPFAKERDHRAFSGATAELSPLFQKRSLRGVPYKVYMGPSVGDLFFHTQIELEETIKHYEGQYISFHCEDPEILDRNKSQATHEARRPANAEIIATDFALYLIEKYKLHGKLCHFSTKEGLQKIIAAKQRGLDVVCEVTPHHLYFDETIITEENHKWLQMNPPLRSWEDRLAMIEGLRNGDIDYLATDHAPHTKEEKLSRSSGVPHLDTYGAFCSWLIKEQNFKPSDIARVACYNPGAFVNNFNKDKFGEIKAGFVGSFAVLNVNQKWLVQAKDLKTKVGWSPFTGKVFPGKVKYAIVRGRVY